MEAGYHKRDSRWFSVGRVFTVLWHDNATAVKRYANDTGLTTPGPYGQKIYSQIRRFAVVKQGHGFSWAIPIHTYRAQGTTRESFGDQDREAHAIIHMTDVEPVLLPEERFMRKNPIAVDGASEDKKLHPTSRIRFDKVYTIEHNVLVRNVGKISEHSMPYFLKYWREQVVVDEETEAAL